MPSLGRYIQGVIRYSLSGYFQGVIRYSLGRYCPGVIRYRIECQASSILPRRDRT